MGETQLGNAQLPAPEHIGRMEERGEVKHLSTHRKRNNSDSVSSGERTRNRPNRIDVIKPPGVVGSGLWDPVDSGEFCPSGVKMFVVVEGHVERTGTEGEDPVDETARTPVLYPK